MNIFNFIALGFYQSIVATHIIKECQIERGVQSTTGKRAIFWPRLVVGIDHRICGGIGSGRRAKYTTLASTQ